MTTKKTTTKATTPATAERNIMKMPGKLEDRERLLADLTVEGLFTSAVTLKTYSRDAAGDIGITEAVLSLRRTVAAVNGGDLRSAETMLVGQAGALNAIFAELARRAALNMGEYPDAFERYMRLALKAQGQARATLETLAAIKNPPVFARQANINNGGQQQVNNGPAPENCAIRARATVPADIPAGSVISTLVKSAAGAAHDQTLGIVSATFENNQDQSSAAAGAADKAEV
jgi:hypothetical protein